MARDYYFCSLFQGGCEFISRDDMGSLRCKWCGVRAPGSDTTDDRTLMVRPNSWDRWTYVRED